MNSFSRQQRKDHSLRPPDLYEYFVDNHWFNTVDLENQNINEPLRGSHQADVIIIGGGYTGLSSAYHVKQKFPEKKRPQWWILHSYQAAKLERKRSGPPPEGSRGLILWPETDKENDFGARGRV
jgi:hypothetical protein